MAENFGDLVIVLPGILGSRLVRRMGDREVTVWDLSLRSLPRTLKEIADGGLVLHSSDGKPDDDVFAKELLNYQFLPGFFGIDDYAPLVQALARAVNDPRQLLTFPYDWRGSNRHAAQGLADMALAALAAWRRSSGYSQAKLWLVCHSMGGLVARYFCETLGGAEVTRALITMGTPHRGAMKALDKLVNGMSVLGVLDLTALVRSLPSAYELLPLYPAVLGTGSSGSPAMHRVADFFDLDPLSGTELAHTTGLERLPGIDPSRLRVALEFHQGIRGSAQARWDAGEPSPYRMEAFFNRRQFTAASGVWHDGRLSVLNTLPRLAGGSHVEADYRGDGSVPSFAAVPIEWTDTSDARAVPDKHAAIQCSASAVDSIVNWIRPHDVRELKGEPSSDRDVVALDVPPAGLSSDEIVVRVSALSMINLTIEIQSIQTGRSDTFAARTPGEDGVAEISLGRRAEGTYRVRAIPVDRRLPTVSDYTVVLEG